MQLMVQIFSVDIVQFPFYVIHHMQSNFDNPEDFQPERFSTKNFRYPNEVIFLCCVKFFPICCSYTLDLELEHDDQLSYVITTESLDLLN